MIKNWLQLLFLFADGLPALFTVGFSARLIKAGLIRAGEVTGLVVIDTPGII